MKIKNPTCVGINDKQKTPLMRGFYYFFLAAFFADFLAAFLGAAFFVAFLAAFLGAAFFAAFFAMVSCF